MKPARLVRFAALLVVTAAFASEASLAQTPAAPSAMKTIGTPSGPAGPEIVPSLFVLNSCGATLSAHGFPVQTFTSAESFLEDATSPSADCLLLDIHLSGISGIELQRRGVNPPTASSDRGTIAQAPG